MAVSAAQGKGTRRQGVERGAQGEPFTAKLLEVVLIQLFGCGAVVVEVGIAIVHQQLNLAATAQVGG